MIFVPLSPTYEPAPSLGSPCQSRLRCSTPDQTAAGRPDRSSSRLRRNADGTACSMSLRLSTCDNIWRTVVSRHMSLQGMPSADWGAGSQRCRLREGSGHDRRLHKGLRSVWTVGRKVRFYFCPNCGTSLYWEADARPDTYILAVGAFADPNFPPPSVSIFEESKHTWMQLPDGMKHFQGAIIAGS